MKHRTFPVVGRLLMLLGFILVWLQARFRHMQQPILMFTAVLALALMLPGTLFAADAKSRIIATDANGAQTGIGVRYVDTGASGYVPAVTLVDATGAAVSPGGGSGGTVNAGCQATAAAPSYVEGTSDPLSCSLAGAARTLAVSGSTTAVTQATGTNLHAVTDSGSTTAVTQATGTNLHAVTDSGSTTAVTQATASNLNAQVVGAGASGAASTGNPVQIAGSNGTNSYTLKVDTSGRPQNNLDQVGGASVAVANSGQQKVAVCDPSTIGRCVAVDASGYQTVNVNGTATTSQAANTAVASAAVTVAASATTMPASNLANRKSWLAYNNDASVTMFCGPSGVTTSSGIPVTAGSTLQLYVGPSVTMYCIVASSTINARVVELS